MLQQRPFNFVTSTNTLWRFYLQNGVKFRTGQAVYRQAVTKQDAINKERAAFALVLANILATGKPVIYTDETTFNAQLLKSKSWSTVEEPVLHSKNDKKFGTTVYGALGRCLKHGFYVKLGSSTNMDEWKAFFLELRDHIFDRHWDVKPYLLYDGHAAHCNKEIILAMEAYFIPVQVPRYSCEFNCK